MLDVLTCVLDELTLIQGQRSDRLAEICVGIAANLACHSSLAGRVLQAPRLRAAVLQHMLWRSDPAFLAEACRLLSEALQDSAWHACVLAPHVLDRLCWVLANTLHSCLLERYSTPCHVTCTALGNPSLVCDQCIEGGTHQLTVGRLQGGQPAGQPCQHRGLGSERPPAAQGARPGGGEPAAVPESWLPSSR